jgi:hypothetical protein
MDRLSEKAAGGLPFDTWREAEAFMRGDTLHLEGRTHIPVLSPEEFLLTEEAKG